MMSCICTIFHILYLNSSENSKQLCELAKHVAAVCNINNKYSIWLFNASMQMIGFNIDCNGYKSMSKCKMLTKFTHDENDGNFIWE